MMSNFHSYIFRNNRVYGYKMLSDARVNAIKGDVIKLYNFGRAVHEETI